MSTELVPKEEGVLTKRNEPINPFQKQQSEHINAGTVSIEEQRAIAEVQGKLVIAKRFPRDEFKAFAKIIESCKRVTLAEEATYAFPKGGKNVSGPSIRLAEELARVWGNIDYGIRELSRKDGVSEMEAYAWDQETNTSSSQRFSVKHILDTRGGAKVLTEERDIYEITANQGARRLRARILAILPGDLVDQALAQCRATLAGNSEEPIADRVRNLIRAFDKLGINEAILVRKLGHSLDKTLPEEIADLREIYNSIKNGFSSTSEWFGGENTPIAPATVPAPQQTRSPRQQTTAPKAETPTPAPAPQQPQAPAPSEPDPPKQESLLQREEAPAPQQPTGEISDVDEMICRTVALGKTEKDLTDLFLQYKILKDGQTLRDIPEAKAQRIIKGWAEINEALTQA